MAAYWIAHVTILDSVKYKEYTDIAPDAFKKHGAIFLARGGEFRALEGDSFERHVVIQFPDLKAAEDCYFSQEYQVAKRKRDGYCNTLVTIVAGV